MSGRFGPPNSHHYQSPLACSLTVTWLLVFASTVSGQSSFTLDVPLLPTVLASSAVATRLSSTAADTDAPYSCNPGSTVVSSVPQPSPSNKLAPTPYPTTFPSPSPDDDNLTGNATRNGTNSTCVTGPPVVSSVPQPSPSNELTPTPYPTAFPSPSPDNNSTGNATRNDTNSTCTTGPQLTKKELSFLYTEFMYLDVNDPVQCSGVVTGWDFCYGVFAFRTIRAEVWPSVWRRNGSDYDLVAQNKIGIVPNEDDVNGTIRCREGEMLDTYDYIEVKEGDFIGFFIPDNGLFIPKTTGSYDPDAYQLRRLAMGYTIKLLDNELVELSEGRPLVKANIDSRLSKPIPINPPQVIPETQDSLAPSGTPADIDVNPASKGYPVGLISVIAAAGGIIIVLFSMMICLGALVLRKHKIQAATGSFSDSMEYNGMYHPRNEAEIVVAGQRKMMDMGCNAAYTERQMLETSERRALDHTYESLSNLSVHTVRHLGIGLRDS